MQALQPMAGNSATAALLSVQRGPKKKAAPKSKSQVEIWAESVSADAAKGRFIEPAQPGTPDTPAQPGGAFWLLNGLSPQDMLDVLEKCSKATRSTLLAHIAETDGHYGRVRMESALRSTAWGEKKAGTRGIELLDAITSAGTKSFAAVWARLAGASRVNVIATLRPLPRPFLTNLRDKLSDAPAAERTKFSEVLADLIGTGTDMQAKDVIDLQGLSGEERLMASLYNLRGQLIEEQSRALSIPTHAAAGIMKAESGGQTFSPATDKTIARFEVHWFHTLWGLKKANRKTFDKHFYFKGGHKEHGFREKETDAWIDPHRGGQAREWQVINFAAGLSDDETAYKSGSFGAGQVMGFNCAKVGFATAVDMVKSFNIGERPQITGIFSFIRATKLEKAIAKDDYLKLAKTYNGLGDEAKAKEYAATVEKAARTYKKVTAGMAHVIP